MARKVLAATTLPAPRVSASTPSTPTITATRVQAIVASPATSLIPAPGIGAQTRPLAPIANITGVPDFTPEQRAYNERVARATARVEAEQKQALNPAPVKQAPAVASAAPTPTDTLPALDPGSTLNEVANILANLGHDVVAPVRLSADDSRTTGEHYALLVRDPEQRDLDVLVLAVRLSPSTGDTTAAGKPVPARVAAGKIAGLRLHAQITGEVELPAPPAAPDEVARLQALLAQTQAAAQAQIAEMQAQMATQMAQMQAQWQAQITHLMSPANGSAK